MNKYYFVEILHICGTTDKEIDRLKEIFYFNPSWGAQFNEKGASPVIIAIESGNIEMAKFLVQNATINNNIAVKIFNACLGIKKRRLKFLMLKTLLQEEKMRSLLFNEINMPLIARKIFLEESYGLFFIKKYKIPFLKEHQVFNNILFDLIEGINSKKILIFKHIIDQCLVFDLINCKKTGLSLTDYINKHITEKKLNRSIHDIIQNKIKAKLHN